MNTGGSGGVVNSCAAGTSGNSASVTYTDNTVQPPTTRTEYYTNLPLVYYLTFLAARTSEKTVTVTVDGTGACTGVTI